MSELNTADDFASHVDSWYKNQLNVINHFLDVPEGVRMEAVQRNYGSAVALRQMLENKMDIRAKIIRTNTNLLQELEKVSTLNQSILEQEIFTTEQSQKKSDKLQREKDALQKAEEKISHLSDNLNEYGFSKEGVGIREMVTEWLTAIITSNP
jgi:hypothetical protein